MSAERYDVAIVGASVGGCTAAKLYAERGARVALLEKRPDPAAYKTVCTHYVQASATPVIEKLGLAPELDARGANHNVGRPVDAVQRAGSRPLPDDPYGYSVTRRTLDPLLRAMTAETERRRRCSTGATVAGLDADGVVLRDGTRVGGAARRRRRRPRRRPSRSGRGCAGGCGRTTGSSTGRTGGASSRTPTAAACG